MKKVEKRKKKLEVKKEKVRPLTDDDLDKVAGASAACLSVIRGSGMATSQPPSAGVVQATGVIRPPIKPI